MLALLKLIQSLIKTLHSDGSPAQIAAGIALGAGIGLTPLVNVHNVAIVVLLMILDVSFGAGMLGWALFVPVGFLLDPAFDRLGAWLLAHPGLRELWTAAFNTPLVPYTNFNNTVVLGSVAGWLLLSPLVYALAHVGVIRYRATLGERVRRSAFYRAVTASKAYNLYRLFVPE